MVKKRIGGKDAINDIRSGIMDAELMKKYNVSARGLQSLFQKLVNKGLITVEELEQRMPEFMRSVSLAVETPESTPWPASIKAQDAVTDIRSGMHDFDLMEKYRLSATGLQTLFDQLVAAGAMELSDLDARMTTFESTVDLRDKTKLLGLDDESSHAEDETEVVDLSWECPACGIFQSREFEKCPECGALVVLLKRKKAED